MDRATEYARSVVAGEVVAGPYHILACQRQLNDIARQGTDEFPYLWVPALSEEILQYAESLTILEGMEPKAVKLFGCQCFDTGVPMGWVHRDTGYRRFRRKYKSVARQNGKTFENGITGSYIAAFKGYQFGKLFTVATKKRQARLSWEEMQRFIIADDDLAEYFHVQDYKSLITAVDTGCTIEALSKEAGLDDGFRSIFASIDELHQHRDGSIYRAIQKGTRTLRETLISMITTRGNKLNSFCFEMDAYCCAVLEGVAVAEDLFVDIYCLDKADDIFDPACFPKSNPVLSQMEGGIATMMSDAATAKAMGGSELKDYLVKCQNMWGDNTDNVFIPVDVLMACRDSRTIADFAGCSAYAGIDLSHGGDLTTIDLEIEIAEEEYFLWSHSFMPRGRLAEHLETDLAPYDIWVKEGLLTVTGGEADFKNDYSVIIVKLQKVLKQYNITLLGIGYDPHNADAFLKDLEPFGVPLLCINQSAKVLNDATVEIPLLAKSGKYHFSQADALLLWSFRNAVCVDKNSYGETKVDKGAGRTGRIDPVDADICAHTARMKLSGKPAFDAQAEMEAYLKLMDGGAT